MRYLWLFAFMLVSCEEQNVLYSETTDSSTNDATPSLWLCHNPESELHGLRCTEDCLEAGNQHAFCWLSDLDYGL